MKGDSTRSIIASSGAAVWRGRIDLAEALRTWLGSVLVIVVLIIVFSALQPRFMSVLNWQNIASQMSVLLVISIAGTFPILVGSIDLSVGSIGTLAGIIVALSLRHGGFEAALAVPIGLLVGLG